MTPDMPLDAPKAAQGLITYLVEVEGVSEDNAIALVDQLLASYIRELQAKALAGDLDRALTRVRELQERYLP